MNRRGRRILITLWAAFLLATPIIASGQQKGSLKNQYQNIEVATFDVKEDAKFPAETLTQSNPSI